MSECLAHGVGILRVYVTDMLRNSTDQYIDMISLPSISTPTGPLLLLFGVVAGGVLGWASNWGSEHGYYHTVMLPLIALEMQRGSFAVLVRPPRKYFFLKFIFYF